MAPQTKSLAELITHPEPELVFAVASPVGSQVDEFETLFTQFVSRYSYETNVLRLSHMVKRLHTESLGVIVDAVTEFERINAFMTAGNALRRLAGRGDIMALYAIAEIRKMRKVDEREKTEPLPKTVHFLRSLKHPSEVEALRRVYGTGFFLIGLHATHKQQLEYLTSRHNMTEPDAHALIARDQSEGDELGQQLRDTFTLSDVFVQSADDKKLDRFLDMVFGNPFHTPTPDEHAMFLAYGASLRSGQLARQVGAIIVSASGEVIGTGANDVPRFGGGLYWPGQNDQRDHVRGRDANDEEIANIIEEICACVANAAQLLDDNHLRQLLANTRVADLTEFGRPVHAELEALLACARSGVSPRGGTLYSTTFPCHNCAKHIVAAGIERVVYVEPYPKSQALALHADSIALDQPDATNRVRFVPFEGVGARRYIDLFSMRLSAGIQMKRKRPDGTTVPWSRNSAKPRVRMSPYSYLDRELIATTEIKGAVAAMEMRAAEEPSAASVGSGGDGTDVLKSDRKR
jgi:deoxycytidylate deaminase